MHHLCDLTLSRSLVTHANNAIRTAFNYILEEAKC